MEIKGSLNYFSSFCYMNYLLKTFCVALEEKAFTSVEVWIIHRLKVTEDNAQVFHLSHVSSTVI